MFRRQDSLFTRRPESRQLKQKARKRQRVNLGLESLESRQLMTVDVWTGASSGSSNWSDDANWQDGSAPTAGEDLVFPAGASQLNNTNDLSGLSLRSVTIGGDGYGISGNAITLTDGISYTLATGTAEFQPDITLTGTETIDVASGGDFIVSGAISGPGFGITKTGGGTLEYTGFSANTYTGTTTVDGGTLILNRASGLDAIAGDLVIGDNSTGALVQVGNNNQIADGSTVTVNEGSTFDLGGSSETIALLQIQGATVTIGSVSSVLAVTTGISMPANSNNVASTIQGPGALDLNGGTVDISVQNDTDIGVDGRISVVIQNGSLTKAGSGVLALSGMNTYAGSTTINVGAIQVESDDALGSTAAGTTVASGAAVYLDGSSLNVGEDFTISGAGVSSSGALFNASGSNTILGGVTMGADSQVGAADGTTLTLSGVIDDSSNGYNLTITNVSTGRTVLSGSNTYGGMTTVTSGYLRATNADAFGDPAASSNLTVQDGATLELSGGITLPVNKGLIIQLNGVGGTQANVINLAGDNAIDGAIVMTGNEEFQQASGTTLQLNGVISESSSGHRLITSGPGVLILNATNTYTGTTFVTAGTLLVDGSIATSSDVQVFSATLGGSGTVPGVTIGSGGTLAPGDSPGILNTGNLDLSSGSTYSVELNGTSPGTGYDQTNVNGSVTLAGATLSVSLSYAATIGDTYTIIQSSSGVSGTFNGLAQGSTFNVGNLEYSINYAGGGSGFDVVLNLVGITSTWTGLGGDSNWSTDANWDTNIAPSGGNDLVFPAGAARLSNTNDLSGITLRSITIDGSGYAITGNAILVTDGVVSTYGTGTSTFGLDTTLTGTEAFDVASGGTLDMSGSITVDNFGGGYGVTKSGGGTLRFSGSTANLYNGTTTVLDGTLQLAKADDVISANGSVIVGDNTTGATLQVLGNNQFWVGSNVTVHEGSTFDVGSQIQHISNLNLQGSTVQIDTGGMLFTFVGINTTATTNDATSSIQGLGLLIIDNTLNTISVDDDVAVDVDLRISTIVQGALPYSGLSKIGAGTLALAGANTYSGTTLVAAGVIQVENNAALGTTAGATNVSSGASVDFSGSSLSITEDFSDVAGSGAGGNNLFRVVMGDAILSGAITMTGSTYVGAVDGSTLTFNSVIDDSGSSYSLHVVNGANGRTVLNGSNLFDGDVVVSSGFLRGNNDNSFGDPTSASSLNIQSGATLELGGGIWLAATKTIDISGVPVSNSSKIRSVSGDNAIQGDIAITGGNNVAFDVAGGTSLTVSGEISGSRDFDKNNTGTLILTGTNTHTGNVNVGEGTMIVNGSLATSNLVFVDGVLGGLGVVPAVTISGIGTLSPGNSPNVLSTGDLVFSDSGSNYAVQLDGVTAGSQYDQTLVSGTVTLASATLSLALGFAPSAGDTFTIINNEGMGAINGTFAGLPEGATFTSSGSTFLITYVGGDGNDVELTYKSVTTTSLSSDISTSIYGDLVTFTAVVSAGLGSPTGTVEFFEGATLLGSGAVDGLGAATYTTSLLSAGVHTVTAFYTGFGDYLASQSSPYDQTVAKATLTVTGDDQSREYGDANPTFTASFSGFKNGQTLATSDVVGSPDLSTVADPSSPVAGSPYAIVASAGTLAAGNYDFSFVDGSLNVTKAMLTVTADDASRVFGAPNPLFTASFSGFKNGQTLATSDVTGAPDLTTSAILSSPVASSPYVIDAAQGTLASGNYDFAMVDGQMTVTLATASAVLASSANPSSFGHDVVLSATVSPDSPSTITPTGSVAFYLDLGNSSTVLLGSSALDEDGVALFSLSSAILPVGSHDFFAVYLGSDDFQGDAQSEVLTQQVTEGSSTTVISSTTSPSVFGQSVTLTANVEESGASGTVSFFDGATLLGTASLSNGAASLSTSALSVGDHSFVAVYSGDASFTGSTSDPISFTVTKAATNEVVISSSGSTVYGQSVTFTASVVPVAPGAGMPSGTMSFFDGTTLLGIATLDNSGFASFSTSALATGAHMITVAYSGDSSFAVGVSSAIIQVVGVSGTVAAVSAPSSSILGQMVTIMGSVSPVSPATGLPSGYLTFLSGSTVLGVAPLVHGVATFQTASLGVNGHVLTVSYTGDSSFAPSTSGPSFLTVSQAASSVVLSASATSSVSGQPITYTAMVNVVPGFGSPTGTVTFYDGTTIVGVADVTANSASLTLTNLSVGTHPIVAVYSGDAQFSASQSMAVVETVAFATSATIFLASPNPAVQGQLTTFTAIVSPGSWAPMAPSGTVSFFDGDALIGTAGLVNNQASLTAALFGVDQVHAIRAVYSGDAHYSTSTSASTTQTLQKADVSGFAEFVPVNARSTRFKALVKVASPGGGAAPSGTIVFRINGRGFRRVQLVDGQASVRLSRSDLSRYAFSYRYTGDSNCNGLKAPSVQYGNAAFAASVRPTRAFGIRRGR